MKYAIVVTMAILMLGSVLVIPAIAPSTPNVTMIDLSGPEEIVSPAADDGLEELKYNVNQNPSLVYGIDGLKRCICLPVVL